MMPQPIHCPLVNEVGAVLGSVVVVVTIHGVLDVVFQHFAHHRRVASGTAVSVQEIGEIEMGLELADVTIELIHSAFVGRRWAAFVATCPFAE